jgi:hypothetical protein
MIGQGDRAMRFQIAGVIVVAVLVLLALTAGGVPAVAVLRVAVVLYVVAAFVEVVVNMVRHRDTHIRSRLLGRYPHTPKGAR